MALRLETWWSEFCDRLRSETLDDLAEVYQVKAEALLEALTGDAHPGAVVHEPWWPEATRRLNQGVSKHQVSVTFQVSRGRLSKGLDSDGVPLPSPVVVRRRRRSLRYRSAPERVELPSLSPIVDEPGPRYAPVEESPSRRRRIIRPELPELPVEQPGSQRKSRRSRRAPHGQVRVWSQDEVRVWSPEEVQQELLASGEQEPAEAAPAGLRLPQVASRAPETVAWRLDLPGRPDPQLVLAVDLAAAMEVLARHLDPDLLRQASLTRWGPLR
ncbi:MAG: hypothetical protein QGG40_20905 [Myxococcota bacterium]|nr:hypothetical protein [Myxococcota bacterium]